MIAWQDRRIEADQSGQYILTCMRKRRHAHRNVYVSEYTCNMSVFHSTTQSNVLAAGPPCPYIALKSPAVTRIRRPADAIAVAGQKLGACYVI